VIPAIDVSRGMLVRFVRGERDKEKVYGDPMGWLELLLDADARLIHIVDLDAAQGVGSNRELVKSLVERATEAGATAEVGGGIRTPSDALEVASWGDVRVILGTLVYLNPAAARGILGELGADRVIAALDVRGGRAALGGWRHAGPSLGDAVRLLGMLGFRYVLYTDVEKDGTMAGPSRPPRWLTRSFAVIVAGGVSGLADLESLACSGVYGVVVGRALMEGYIGLGEMAERGWEM